MIELSIIFFINILFIFFFKRISNLLDCYDYPNKIRRIHKEKIAKIGGFLIMLNILFYYLASFTNGIFLKEDFFFLIVCIFFFLLGYFDDKFDMNPYAKFFFQIIFLFLLVNLSNKSLINNIYISFIDQKIFLGNFNIFLTIFCYLLFINAFNMLDGINLSAGIYTFLFLIFLYLHHSNIIFIVVGLSVLFFLIKNYQNKLFLGNNGSYLLGFILSYSIININNIKIISIEEIFLAMIIPGLDMSRLYFQRIYYKKNPFKADLNHFHHIFLKKFSYSKAIFYIICIINLPLYLSFLIKDSEKIYLIGLVIFFYFFLMYILPNNKNKIKRGGF
jgi:UDP-GlcNAc:undecaprenyl-phosphate GlcNAc-1-phosphate transferase